MLKTFKNNKIISVRKGNISNEGKSGAWEILDNPSYSHPDTTLFKNKVRPKLKHKKRKIIMDKDITPTLFEKLKTKCVQNCKELTQKEIINFLYDLGISNITMARIINDLIENSNATQGSVASMIRFLKQFKSSKQLADELDKMLDDML